MPKSTRPQAKALTSEISTIIAAIALLAVGVPVQAGATDSQLRQKFQIPSEDLNAALMAFSAATRIQMVTSGVPAGLVSPGVDGDESTLNALTALLRGTGMAFRQVDAETIVVVPAQMAQLRPTQFELVDDSLANQPTAAAAPAAGAPGPQQLTEVQVTGTRIIRQGYEAPTPVTAVSIGDLQEAANPNIGDTLNELPVFSGSTTFYNTSSSDNEGAQTLLNLRALSPSRTLVLFDGRRLPTSNTENAPDIDLIPDALIQRVDTVTGGASAVYGSDAVAGVVNYILNTNFTGIKGLIQGGYSGYGDGATDKIQLTLGTTFFGGRLHLELSGDQRFQAEIRGTQRPWNINGESAIQNPAYATNKNAPEFIAEPCCVSTTYPPGGMILSGPLQGMDFGPGGAVGQYNYGYGLTGAGNDDYGGSWQESSMHGGADITPSDYTTHAFARLAFDISENMQIYAEWLNGADHTVDQCCYDYYQTGIGTLYTNNPYIPQAALTAAANAGVTSFTLGDSLRLPTNEQVNGGLGVDDYRFNDVYVLGLKGNLTIWKNSYNWNLYGQQGLSIESFTIGQQSVKTNLSNAIEAVTVGSYGGNTATTSPVALGGVTTQTPYTAANFPNPLGIAKGTITCASNLLPLANPSETSNCVPYNVFGTDVVSQAAINYTQGFAYLREVGHQNIVGGDITGEPFSDWAGPVSVALDAEYRNQSVSGFNDPISELTGFFSTNFFPYFGAEHVTEGAVEAVVPLLKGVPGVQELDFNGAARATDYSVTGYVTTYKLGLEYTPINDLRLRATYSEDIRAPNLNDLFGYSNSHGTTVDPFFGNISSPSYGISEGNPALRDEKAHQVEIGLVFQPSEVPGLNFSADFWRINVSSEISSLGSGFELTSCYNSRIAGTDTGTSPYCALILRNPNGSLYGVITVSYNISSALKYGIDYKLDYRKQLTELVSSWKGALSLDLNVTNVMDSVTNSGVPGPAQITESGPQASRYTALGTLTYDLDPWRFVWTERFQESGGPGSTSIVCGPSNCPNPIPAGFTTFGFYPRSPSYFLTNFTVDYTLMRHDQENAEAFIQVNNLFNKIPPIVLGSPGQLFAEEASGGTYDIVGLYARVGLRFQF